jgi:hypothetical protein
LNCTHIVDEHIEGWKHGKVYIRSCWKNIKLKKGNFSQKHKKVNSSKTWISFWNYWALDWVYCKSTTKSQKNWNNKSRE